MASDNQIRAIITVLDRTQAPLHAINQRFAAFGAPLTQLGERLGRLAEETGLTTIGERAGDAFEHVRHLGEGILELAGPLAALGAAGSIAGLVEIAKSTAEFGEQLKLGAVSAGLSTEQLSGWHYAAQLANLDAQQLDRGLGYLNREIALAAGGEAKDVATILRQMGFSNTPGHLVSTADALKAVAGEAKHLVDTGHIQTANAMMGSLFGERAGMQLLPLFGEGPAAINKILAEAQEHGIALSDSQAEQAARFADSYKGMSASVEGLKLAIGSDLFPVLTPIVERMTRWIDANREWIATGIGETLRNIDWGGIKDGIGGIAEAFRTIFNWATWLLEPIGGVKALLVGLAVFSLSPLITSFFSLGSAVAWAAFKFALFPAGAFVASLASLIPTIGSATDAFAAFDLVLSANPVGAVVLGITALAAAAYEIYEHWQPIAEFFETLWDGIVAAFDAAWDKIEPIIDAVRGAVDFIASHMPNLAPTVTAGGENFMVDPSGSGQLIDLGKASLTALPGGGPAGAPANAAAGSQSEAKVTVDFKNLPPDAKTDVETKGNPNLDLNLGYAFPF